MGVLASGLRFPALGTEGSSGGAPHTGRRKQRKQGWPSSRGLGCLLHCRGKKVQPICISGHILGSALTVPSIKLLPNSQPHVWHKEKLHLPWPALGHSQSHALPQGNLSVMTSLSAKSATPPQPAFSSPFGGCLPSCQAPLCCFSHARALTSLAGCSHSIPQK